MVSKNYRKSRAKSTAKRRLRIQNPHFGHTIMRLKTGELVCVGKACPECLHVVSRFPGDGRIRNLVLAPENQSGLNSDAPFWAD